MTFTYRPGWTFVLVFLAARVGAYIVVLLPLVIFGWAFWGDSSMPPAWSLAWGAGAEVAVQLAQVAVMFLIARGLGVWFIGSVFCPLVLIVLAAVIRLPAFSSSTVNAFHKWGEAMCFVILYVFQWSILAAKTRAAYWWLIAGAVSVLSAFPVLEWLDGASWVGSLLLVVLMLGLRFAIPSTMMVVIARQSIPVPGVPNATWREIG